VRPILRLTEVLERDPPRCSPGTPAQRESARARAQQEALLDLPVAGPSQRPGHLRRQHSGGVINDQAQSIFVH
jgi:hypothetical protein